RLHPLPIDAVHIGFVKAVLHDAPALLEDLTALGAMIHVDTGREVDPAGAATLPGGRTPAGSAPGGRRGGRSSNRFPSTAATSERDGIDAVPLAIEQHAVVFGKLQRREAAAATQAPARSLLLVVGLSRLRHPGYLLAVQLH